MKYIFALLLSITTTISSAQLVATEEIRYCGPPARTASGAIARRSDVLTAFKRNHPCPSTGLKTGPCPGWAMDHVIPLACGGCDAVYNLQWLPDAMKSAAGTYPKDRWERVVYANSTVYDGPACQSGIVK